MNTLLLRCAGAAASGILLACSAFGQFSDDFESYTDRENLGNWQLTGVGDPPVLPTAEQVDLATIDPDTGVANKTIRSERGNIHNTAWGFLEPTNASPVVFKIRMYDPFTKVVDEETNEEVFPVVNSYATIRPNQVGDHFVAVGLASFVDDAPTYDRSRYQARVMGGGNWIQLDTPRSEGWHEFTVVMHESSVDIYVDGVPDAAGSSRPRGGANAGYGHYVDRIDIGGTLVTNAAVHWDDVRVIQDGSYARDFHIIEHPESVMIVEGENASFSVEVIGSGSYTYVWTKDGEPIEDGGVYSGATTATLTITEARFEDAGDYQVLVTDGDLTLKSSVANLIVTEAPPLATGIRFETFESVSAPTTSGTYMFRQPTYSGSTYNADPALSQIASKVVVNGAEVDPTTMVVEEFPEGTWGQRVLRTRFAFLPEKEYPWIRFTPHQDTTNGQIPPNRRNPVISIEQYFRFDMYTNEDVYVALSVRESNSTEELGTSGLISGPLEWIGGSADDPGPGVSAPKGVLVKAGKWTAVYFDIPNEFIKPYTGDGVLKSTTGKVVLDSLGLVPARKEDNTYPLVYEIFFDNFEITEVGPPAPAEAPSVRIVRGDDDAINLIVEGEANATYDVFVSGDLVDWGDGPVGTVTLDGEGNGQYTDTEGTAQSRRFYKISVQ